MLIYYVTNELKFTILSNNISFFSFYGQWFQRTLYLLQGYKYIFPNIILETLYIKLLFQVHGPSWNNFFSKNQLLLSLIISIDF